MRVVYEERAIDQLAGFLSDDPAGVAAVLDAVDRRRLRVNRYRVLYEISADEVRIGNVARTRAVD
jgi:mRNA-degrading endonuclease RelE of RelBE toxin-antitoxin system